MGRRLVELENQLKSSEEQLQDYRDKQQLIDLEGVLTISNDEILELTKSLVLAQQKKNH